MRRVVVTGWGSSRRWHRRRANLATPDRRPQSGIGAIQSFDVSDLPCAIAAQVPRGDGSRGLFNADDWVPPKDQRQMDEFIVYAMARRRRRSRMPAGSPRDEEERERTGVMIGSGIGGLPASTDGAITLHEKGPAPGLAVLHPRPPDQSGLRPRLDPLRLQGAEPRGRHRLLDRRACDRRRGAADHARRCRRDGGGGAEARDLPARPRRLRRGRALSTGFNDEPDARLAALGPGPRRLRDGRGRRHPGARGATSTPRPAAPRSMPRSIGYGMSGDAYHMTAPGRGRRRRLPLRCATR